MLSVLGALEAEMVFMRNLIGGVLAELEDDIDRDKFLSAEQALEYGLVDEVLASRKITRPAG